MRIPKETLEDYENLKEEGDIELLSKELNKSKPTVYNILSGGKVKLADALIVNEFFKKRKKQADSVKIKK
jgi:hypothetical protein